MKHARRLVVRLPRPKRSRRIDLPLALARLSKAVRIHAKTLRLPSAGASAMSLEGCRERPVIPAGTCPDGREQAVRVQRQLVLLALVLALTACASSPPRAPRSEFEDVPVPSGLEPDPSKSTVIESPSVKAARLFYKGRIKPDSLAAAFRTTLEANGWHHLSSTTAAEKGTSQVYEKPASSLQVLIYEGWYYTWVELLATRVVSSSQVPAR